MAAPELTSPVTPPAPGWARPFPRDERIFLWVIVASAVLMTAFTIGWLYVGHQNVPVKAHATTPAAYAAKVSAFAQRYGAADGRVYVPPGTDAYMLASRYTWYPELVLQRGTRYRIWLSSADVLHGFSLVNQNLNLEVAPNHVMGVHLTVGKPGRYLIVCNEFCGLNHQSMQGRLDVVAPAVMKAHLAGKAAKSGTAGGVAAPGVLRLKLRGNGLAFDRTTLTAKAGKVTLQLTNPSAVPHNIAIRGNGVLELGALVTGGGRSTVTANLKPGTYTFFCSVPGHEQAGMRGTLKVTP